MLSKAVSIVKKLSFRHFKKLFTPSYILYAAGAALVMGGALVWLSLQTVTLTFFGVSRQQNTLEPLVIEVPFENLTPGVEQFALEKFIVPKDADIITIDPQVEGDSGAVQSLDLYYHGALDPYCANLPLWVYHAGSGLQPIHVSEPYGIAIKKDERLFASIHFKNTSPIASSGTVRVRVTTAIRGRHVTPVILSIADYCRPERMDAPLSAQYRVPRGSGAVSMRMERPFFPAAGGRVLGWTGYASMPKAEITLLLKGKVVSRARASSTDSDLETQPGFFRTFPTQPAFQAGDAFDLESLHHRHPGEKFSLEAITLGYILIETEK